MVKNTNFMLFMFYHTKKIIIAREFGRKQESVASQPRKRKLLKENVVKNVRKGE